MAERGALVAAAYQSGAGLHAADPDVVAALLRGEAQLTESVLGPTRANYDALRLARDSEPSEELIRRVHDTACRLQIHHHVLIDGEVHDHVLAAGDYKHHPNHWLNDAGDWEATAPVALLDSEMGRIAEALAGPDFAAFHPVVQAAYLHHAILRVRPFADGNGRVARALAGGCLLRAGSLPLVLGPDDLARYRAARDPAGAVDMIQGAVVALAHRLAGTEPAGEALDRRRRQEAAGHDLRAQLVAGVAGAVARYDAGDRRRADLSGAAVVDGDPVVIRVAAAGVEERLAFDVHPFDGGPVSVTAVEAGLHLKAGDPIEVWLDRVVSTLGLRVAAALE